jgi:hypothetical protein
LKGEVVSERKGHSDTSLSRHGGIECLILNAELREDTISKG